MKDFLNHGVINQSVGGFGGASIFSALSGELIVAIISAAFMIAFAAYGTYLRHKDSKALHEALERGAIEEAIRIRSKN